MNRNNYSLEVLVNGRPTQEYHKDDRSFIESRDGTEYTLRFRNNGWKRVLAVFSVDGVEVLKGKAAAQADNGYIVDPFSSIDIKGYRIDEENVASFKFAGSDKSYALQVGAVKKDRATGKTTHEKTDRNNGVIGVRVFEEDVAERDYAGQFKQRVYGSGGTTRTHFYPSNVGTTVTLHSTDMTGCAGNLVKITTGSMSPAQSNFNTFTYNSSVTHAYNNSCNMGGGPIIATSASFTTAPLPQGVAYQNVLVRAVNLVGERPICGVANAGEYTMSRAVAPSFDMGTTWGTKTVDKVREVSFKKVATSTDIEIYYASKSSLEQFGVDFSRTKQVFNWPSAFEDKKQYCTVPPGYKL